MTDPQTKNRPVALVTGASGGIGLALAELLAERGYDLILVARRAALLERIASDISAQYGCDVKCLVFDLQEPQAAGDLKSAVETLGFEIDLLVNNAGFGVVGAFHEAQASDQIGMIDLNVRALAELTHLFLPDLIARRGGILNVASLSAYVPMPTMAIYGATKAFVLSFSKMLHDEVAPLGVRVTALCPGYTPTGFLARAGMGQVAVPKWVPGHSSEQVARIGLAGYDKGRAVVIVGFSNKLSALLARWLRPLMRLASRELSRRIKTGS